MATPSETVKKSDLKAEKARPSVFGIRSPYRSGEASAVTPKRLARLLKAADDGDTDAYFTLASEIQERYPHYDAVLRSRKQAVSGAELHVAAPTDKRRDRKITDEVRKLVSDPMFESLAFDLLDGLGKGASFVEIIWDTAGDTWKPSRFVWREQRHFTWDIDTLSVPLLKTNSSPLGEPLAPYKWAVHMPQLRSGPLAAEVSRSAVVFWMLQSFTVRDMMAFLEQYGMPVRIGKYPVGATEEQKQTLIDAVTNLGTDAGCTIPDSMVIDLIERKGGSGGDQAFLKTCDWLNGEMSKLVLGQTMTTENGSLQAQATVHERKEPCLIRADARALAATINRDVIAPFVRLNWGDAAEVPRCFYKIRSSAEQATFMANVTQFVKLGGEVEQSVVRDELGLPDPPEAVDGQDPPKLLRASAPAVNEPAPPVDGAPQ